MRQYFAFRQQELFAASQVALRIGHSTPAGFERELITSQFISSHLPKTIDVLSGVLVDQATTDLSGLTQENSPQIDLALVTSHQPRLRYYGGTQMLFAESVAAVVEVKKRLTSGEFSKVIAHCKKVKERRRQILGLYSANNDPTSHPADRVPYYAVAFEADLSVETVARKLRESSDQDSLPDGIFVLDPAFGTVVLRHIGIHVFGIGEAHGGYSAANLAADALLVLWMTLLSQAEAIRQTTFPHAAYAKAVLSTG